MVKNITVPQNFAFLKLEYEDLRRYDINIILIIICILLGLAMLFKTETLWKIQHYFTVKTGKPTNLYLKLVKLGGAFLATFGIILLIIQCYFVFIQIHKPSF